MYAHVKNDHATEEIGFCSMLHLPQDKWDVINLHKRIILVFSFFKTSSLSHWWWLNDYAASSTSLETRPISKQAYTYKNDDLFHSTMESLTLDHLSDRPSPLNNHFIFFSDQNQFTSAPGFVNRSYISPLCVSALCCKRCIKKLC